MVHEIYSLATVGKSNILRSLADLGGGGGYGGCTPLWILKEYFQICNNETKLIKTEKKKRKRRKQLNNN